jgi:phosphoribosyl-dephospho-CoA transferase
MSVECVATQLPGVHSLLRIAAPQALLWEDQSAGAPDWAHSALQRLPFVVVRRHPLQPGLQPGLLPVGIRGIFRSQRAPAWLPVSAVRECVTPRMLAAKGQWRRVDVCSSPAIAVLNQVELILAAHRFAGSWGPGGSVGAELASGVVCTTAASDLDLIVYLATALDPGDASALHAELSALPVRVDTLLETPQGGVALADLTSGAERMLLRTPRGPRLVPATLQDLACPV